MELGVHQQVLLYGFLGAMVLGAVANKTNFCTMGAVSDWINMGKRGRLWAWFTAIAVALIGVMILEYTATASLDSTIPPYRSANFAWARYLVGGVMFGIGMTLAGGCGNKTLLNVGDGNLKSLMVAVVIGIMAYLMTKTAFYEHLFHGWVSATTIDLGARGVPTQSVYDLIATGLGLGAPAVLHYLIGGVLAAAILVMAFRDRHFRGNTNNILAGLVVGLAVVGAWCVTAGPLGQAWAEEVMWMDAAPLSVGAQSYTFINPLGESLYWLQEPGTTLRVTFGVMAVAGVILGSFLYAVIRRKFHLVWFTSLTDFVKHLAGGVLMGVGGVLAMGCTIGQGITGVSTLALGSFLALGGIIFGAALTMKVQYYKLVYEEEASMAGALLSSMVDMHLLPGGLRRLEKP